ncbi:nitric oxide-sensing protein NosP [Sedimenticola sp.]|uniref:nitric oxide-sensing protein NosP n=1 Tax=Sedimenticola sp. TaxID=1940285 RepID=UPI00258C43CD|nr:nitric oxide-sensing protein NosP [Sedimenticola sp.]MCW8905200.1 FIST C-terminal domain-containing protein [Sedimenticola sp.]
MNQVTQRTPEIASGVSELRDTERAVEELIVCLGDGTPEAVLFFCSSHHDVAVAGAALSRHFPGSQVIGCTTAGEINERGCLSASLCGFALPRDSFSLASALLPHLSRFDLKLARSRVTELHADLAPRGVAPVSGHSFAFLLVDGLSGVEETVLSVVHGEIGDIPLFGGSAADDLRFSKTLIYYNGEALDDVAVLCMINTTCPFRVFRTQHFVAGERKMVITEADVATRSVSEINGVSAGMEYARLVGLQYDRLDPMTFAAHPVMVRVGGAYYVRSIRQLAEDDSLTFFCAIGEGIVLTVAEGVDLVENLSQTFAEIRTHVGEPQLVIGCDCVFRRLEYMQAPDVAKRVEGLFRANRVVGFNTYGEQFGGMHVNQTFTGVAIGLPRPEQG